MLTVLPWAAADQAAALALLDRHKATSLFLLGNLRDHGPTLTDHLNSGNYKVLVRHGAVAAVFVLTRRGNLLAQTDRAEDYSAAILDACAEEPLAAQGFLGDWGVAEQLWRTYTDRYSTFQTTTCAKDLLFELALPNPPQARPHAGVRTLGPADFERYDALTAAFLADEGLPHQGTPEQRRVTFNEKVRQGHWWGYEADGAVVSLAALNARVDDVGQVGGVYTMPEYRRRGISRAIMDTMLHDAVAVHGLTRLVLFTGEHNRAAQAMYRSLGFEAIGAFALIFGHDPTT